MNALTIHFPDGSREFHYPDREISVGDILWHAGTRYRALKVASADGRPTTVTVELDSDDIGDLLRSERGGIVLDELVAS